MKRIVIIAIIFAAIAGFFAYAKPFKQISMDVANGAVKFKENCISCHGEKGYGDGPLASTFDKKPNDINKKFKKTWIPDNRLSRRILVGKPDTGMPAFKGKLTEKDAEDILTYVRSLE